MAASFGTIGNAYVQIMPSTKGIGANLNKEMGTAGDASGKLAGSNLVGQIKSLIAKAAIGTTTVKIFKEALSAGAKLEQSYMGGVDTIYGEAADSVRKYADAAAQAGISANTYSEQAVGMGAALRQAFGGDTTKSAESANMAILDMADNAAKMGSNVEDLQNAYSGFAKQNYTMLDNLKLGYGGTKSEMERLLADAQKITGVKYDINNLGDVYAAIHAVQGELGLTGVAAEEAGSTFEGSFNAMKASAENLLGHMALGDSIQQPLSDLLTSIGNFLFNNAIPMVMRFVQQIPGAVMTAIQTLGQQIASIAPSQVTKAVKGFMQSVKENLSNVASQFSTVVPQFLQAGMQLIESVVQGFMEGLPQFIAQLPQILGDIGTGIVDSAGALMEGVAGVVMQIAQRLPDICQAISAALPQILTDIATNISVFAEYFIDSVVTIISAIVTSLPTLIQTIVAAIPQIIQTIVDVIVDLVPMLIQGVVVLIQTLAAALPDIITAIVDALPTIIQTIVNSLITLIPVLIEGVVAIVTTLEANLPEIAMALVDAIPQIINAIVEGFKPLTNMLSRFFADVWDQIKSGAENKWNSIKGTLSSIWNTIRTSAVDVFGGMATSVVQKFDAIRSGIQSKMDAVKNIVSNAVEKLKSAFNFQWRLPDLKLPHISVSGGVAPFGIGGKGSLPHFSIQWYANGGILTNPTIFGALGDGTLLGGGEAGPEAVLPIEHLKSYIMDALDEQTSVGNYTQNVYINSPTALTPSEIARQTRNATRQMALGMIGA